MSNQDPENVFEAAIAPETAAVSSQSAEADALLSEGSDETNAAESSEAGLSEEAAAEAEVLKRINSSAARTRANSAVFVNPGAAARSNTKPTISDDKE